jgi:iron complex transport system ATP-binding protein
VSESILSLEGFSAELGGRTVLKSLAFSLRRGERLAVVGPNGAGKTTLLRCLMRIVRTVRGSARFDGRELAGIPQHALARRVAYVPQAAGLPVPYTVADFLLMGRYPHLGPIAPAGEKDRAAVRAALRDTAAEPFEDRFLDALSGGERQRVFLAAALAQEPDLLLLDEHGAFLDPAHQVEIQKVLRRVHAERNLTIIGATHDLNAALSHYDRILALREGEIRFDGPPAAFVAPGVLRDVFHHEFVISSHPGTGRPVLLAE